MLFNKKSSPSLQKIGKRKTGIDSYTSDDSTCRQDALRVGEVHQFLLTRRDHRLQAFQTFVVTHCPYGDSSNGLQGNSGKRMCAINGYDIQIYTVQKTHHTSESKKTVRVRLCDERFNENEDWRPYNQTTLVARTRLCMKRGCHKSTDKSNGNRKCAGKTC